MGIGLLEFGATGAHSYPTSWLVEFARAAESHPFNRLWFGEHAGGELFARPEVPIAVSLMATSRIRIGAGGVLLRHRSVSRLLADFRLLSDISDGRVELGLARGAYTGGAVPPGDNDSTFWAKAARVASAVRSGVWLLGSSGTRKHSELLRLPYALAHFLQHATSSPPAVPPDLVAFAVHGIRSRRSREAVRSEFSAVRVLLTGDAQDCLDACVTEAAKIQAANFVILNTNPNPKERLLFVKALGRLL